ncbi:MAG TPA: serine/threonine-protein kinase, partial [Gemmatimonadales bacterium]|nr:serine/threonine-protein kinase [Gemmatimonadales bacterium]
MSVLATLSAAVAGRYEVERELGHGGMAEVYVARDLRVGRRVAIKALRPEMAQAVGPDRFLREIDIAARLQHPHILPLFDSAVANGLLYYVMPLVEGETLRERLRREVQLPIAETLHIARQVADALDYAHAHGVVHRDVKPENVLLDRHTGRALLADFGIARAMVAEGSVSTGQGVAVGTPAYMSPEQAAGEEVDRRSDLYALGVVGYEMLA